MNRFSKVELQHDNEGYLCTPYNWWFNQDCPIAFEIFDPHKIYKEQYYKTAEEDNNNRIETINQILKYTKNIKTIINFGSGGGWFTRDLIDRGFDVTDIEINEAGITRSIDIFKIPKEKIIKQDLREDFNLKQKFDLGICMEVAEHIECPFSAMLVQNIIKHTNLLYFTCCEPRSRSHIHHCNEQPYKFWYNIFQFYQWYPYIKFNQKRVHRMNGVFLYSGKEYKEAMIKINNQNISLE